MSKIHPKGIVKQATGPVFTCNDPLKFHGAGKTSGKTPSNGVETRVPGPTLTVNSTHIPSMNANKASKGSKSMGEKPGVNPFKSSTEKNASTVGTSGGQSGYPLKKSY